MKNKIYKRINQNLASVFNKLRGRQIIIYPYGSGGKLVEKILGCYNRHDCILIDNNLCDGRSIHDKSILENMDLNKCSFLAASVHSDDIYGELCREYLSRFPSVKFYDLLAPAGDYSFKNETTRILSKYNRDPYYVARDFEKYASIYRLSRHWARFEFMKMIADTPGHIVECGVRRGSGVIAWSKLSSQFDTIDQRGRNIIGFDTFEGFPHIDDKDKNSQNTSHVQVGFFRESSCDVYDEIIELNRHIRYYGKRRIDLVRGDACETIPQYVKENPEMLVALLYLDFDLYEPTKTALDYFLPRIPKGGVIVFDELNSRLWPGETAAAFEKFPSLNALAIRKLPFQRQVSYVVL